MEITKINHNGVPMELLVVGQSFVRFYQIPEGFWYFQSIGNDRLFKTTVSVKSRAEFLMSEFGVKE